MAEPASGAPRKPWIQIAHFRVSPENQGALVSALLGEVERWVRHCPGFISSTLHADIDGRHVFELMRWRSAADFEVFARHPEMAKLIQAITEAGPDGPPEMISCTAVEHIGSAEAEAETPARPPALLGEEAV